MKALTRLTVLATLAFVCMSAAYAVGPAYFGPMGNPEEPAVRPYKWAWRGLKALGHQSVQAFEKGNLKTPMLGSIETLRGARKGAVELGESTFRGLMGTVPPPKGHYKGLGRVNTVIDDDLLLRNVADGFTTIYPAQKVIDHYPVQDEDTQLAIEEKARAVRQARKEAARERARARERYLGDRMVVNKTAPYTGNLLKLAR